ncbi:MAG: GntR family transcriptional regulator [Rhodospirillaceae bacterium]|nr:GntR family transcriptional regulator [Rhodospirillaceae bacterium]
MSEQTFSTKTEQAYWVLRKAIVTGEFGDWAPLDEVELMSQIDAGRTPIREAIKRLASEEFVVWHPHRTPHVRTTSADDLAALYEARQTFEVTAVRLAAQRATPADIELMEKPADQLDKAIADKKLYEVAEFDYDFHLAVAKASHNRFLVEAISHLNLGSLRLWYRSYVRIGTTSINDHHRETLEAIRRRDVDLAMSITQAHIEFSHERQLRLFGLSAGLNSPAESTSSTRKPARDIPRLRPRKVARS